MPKPRAPDLVRRICGPLPSTGVIYDIRIFSDSSIRITRNYCDLITRKEFGPIEESRWEPHWHLIGLIEPTAWYDMSCVSD